MKVLHKLSRRSANFHPCHGRTAGCSPDIAPLAELDSVGRDQLFDFGNEGLAGSDAEAVAEQEDCFMAVVQAEMEISDRSAAIALEQFLEAVHLTVSQPIARRAN